MAALDYKEIAQGNVANGHQDTFEMFARDFFELLGFQILSGPDRGQDDGRDIVILENRTGQLGTTKLVWLVSCKHKAHSGQSVGEPDETNIVDRINAHNAKGFIAFYSTLPSSGLGRRFQALKAQMEIGVFDASRIETFLLNSPKGRSLAKRYMPISYAEWNDGHQSPSNILSEYHPLCCKKCGKDLLKTKKGNVVFVEQLPPSVPNRVIDFYWACKGVCDRALEKEAFSNGGITSWEDITDLTIPAEFLRWNFAIMNRLRDQADIFEDGAYNRLKEFIICMSQIVMRQQTEDQIERFKALSTIHYI